MYDGRFNTALKDDRNGIIRPYALSLFHGAPRDVLMIGLSSGSWAQVIASNPAVNSLTIVEINPGYRCLDCTAAGGRIGVAQPEGHHHHRRWQTLVKSSSRQRFDAIVSNTTWNFRANVTNLLSIEFLDLATAAPQPARNSVLQHHRFRSRAANRLPGISVRRALHQPYGRLGQRRSTGIFRAGVGRWNLTSSMVKKQFDPQSADDRALLDSVTSPIRTRAT